MCVFWSLNASISEPLPLTNRRLLTEKKKHCGTIFIKISIKQKEKSVRLCLREKALKKTCWKQPNISMSFGKWTYWTAPPRGQS